MTELARIPDGYEPVTEPIAMPKNTPVIPEGYEAVPEAEARALAAPKVPEGFEPYQPTADELKALTAKPGIIDKIGQPITDPKQAEAMANAQGAGVLEGAKNLAKGIGERFVQLEGGAVRDIATVLPGSDPVSDFIYWATGTEKPANYPTPEEVTKTGQEVAKQMENVDLGFEEGDSWEDVKSAPASKFLPWAFKQGLLSAPDMALAIASLPGYAAIRTGELAQDRAENDQRSDATVEDMLKTAPAAVVSGLLDRIGGRAMFGLDDVAVQGLKQIPKEAAKATVKEGITEGLQEGVESVATTAGTEKGFDAAQTGEQMLAGTLAGGVTGGAVRTGTGTLEAAVKTDTPVEGDQSATVETETPPLQAPVTQDGGEEVASPPVSSSSSVTPEERAILRRTSMPDEDIDAMSPEERAVKVEEAKAAGIRVNGAMVRAAEQYQAPAIEPLPENIPIPAERPQMPVESVSPVETPVAAELPVPAPVSQPEPELTPETQQQLADTARQSVEADRAQQVEQAVQPVMPQLQQAVQESVAADQDKQAEQAIEPVRPQLAQTVQESVAEDIKGDGTRQAPVYVQQPQHIDVAAQRVNTEPSQAQIEAGNYAKGHIKVGGLDITIENPKGSTRTGTSPNGQQWSVNMPAHYGYLKRSSGADGDQVDVYVGDNPASKRVYVVDQRDPATRRFDEHKAVMGVSSVSEARDLYARAFSDQSGFDRLGAITPMTIAEFKAWLREGDTTKPLRMGKGVRTNEQGFPVDLKGAVKKPDSLIEFLARKGGVREDRGELSVLGLRDRKSGFVTGAGPLIRKNGMHPDKAREAAAEAGYLPMESSLADFYDALDADARSGRQQFSQYDDDWAMAWRDTVGEEARKAEQDAAEASAYENYRQKEPSEVERQRRAIYIRLLEEGYAGTSGDDFSQRVARYATAGESFEDAVFYAYDEMRKEALSNTPGMPDIPFFGDEDNEAFAGTTAERKPGAETGGFPGDDAGSEVETDGTVGDRTVRGEGGPEAEIGRGREDGQRSDREGESNRPAPVKAPVASWVVREKATGNVVLETFEKRTADAINKDKYEAVPIQEHLASLSKPKQEPTDGVTDTEDSELLDGFPQGYRFSPGKGLAKGKWAVVDENGKMVWNYGDTKDEAVKIARNRLRNIEISNAEKAAQAKAEAKIRDKLFAGEDLNDNDLKTLSLRDTTGFEYLSPVVQRLFGLSNRKVREAMGDALKKTYTDFGVEKWRANTRAALANAARFAKPSEEAGADGKPQTVIPGAERVSDADIAQRRADAPLKPKVAQKDAGGLFSDERDQKDLLDLSLNVEDNLIAQHNLAASNLLFSQKMGGLAVPSLAISNVDHPLDGFGEITLLGEKDLIDPKKDSTTKVFDADIYSPRYPTVRYKIASPAMNKAWKRLGKVSEELGHVLSSEIDHGEVERKGLEAFRDSSAVQLQFLRDTGRKVDLPQQKARSRYTELVPDLQKVYVDSYSAKYEPEIKELVERAINLEIEQTRDAAPDLPVDELRSAYYDHAGDIRRSVIDSISQENRIRREGGVDRYAARKVIRDAVQPHADEFAAWVEKEFGQVISGETVANESASGNVRYLPHTLDNVVKIMRKKLQDGEGWNYGVGSIRSTVAHKFTSISGIKKARDRVISGDAMKAVKDEIDKDFMALAERLQAISDNKSFGFLDNLCEHLKEVSQRNVNVLNRYYPSISTDLKQDVVTFLDKLANLPTEYFEAKLQRAVPISDFKIAVIPATSAPDVRKALSNAGLRVFEYDGTREDRANVTKRAAQGANLLFSANAPSGWDMADTGEPAALLSETEQKRLAEIVLRTSGLNPEFVERINVPANAPGLMAWGKGGEEGSTAAGFYANMRDAITLALDTAPVRAGKVAYHESFHRLQNLFLNDKERKLLKANDARLRKMIADKGEYPAKTVEAMSRKEVEAEAFGIWADSQDNAGVHIGIRKVWKNIRDMLTRVRNYLKGQGYQTVEDVFGKAKSGEIAKRPKQESKSDGKDYAIVDRAPDAPAKPKTSVPTTPKPKTRFSDRLDAYSKAIAAKMKSKGGKFDRLTEGDEETFGDLATRKVLDYLDPVLKMQQKVGGDLNDLSDAYLTARLAEGTIRHELHQVDEKYVQPAIKELAAVGATEKDLHEYLYAMHAPERNRVVGLRNEPDSDLYKAATDPSIRGASGMSTNEAKQILAELAKDRQKFMGIRRAASHIRAMLDDGLKRQLRAGLINKATYDELTQQWQHYVPLRAESDTDGTGGGMPSKSRGFDVRGDEFKGATGRYTKADNVVNYAVNNAEQSIIRAEKNKAATAALRFINQFDPEGESIAKVYWSEDPDKLGDITKAPPVYRRKLGKDGKVTSVKVNAFQMKDDVLAAKVGGKTYYMQFADPKVGLALKKMTFGELGATMRMLKTVSNWQSLINTRANPAFIPINFLRDVQTGATIAMSKDFKAGEIAKMVGSIPSAWGALWRDARGRPGSGRWDKIVADFKANGGKISFDQYNTVEETAKKIQKDLAKAGSRGIAGKTWRGFIDLVENLNDTIENGIRVAIYNGAIEQGKTPKRAAFLARDMTVDFQKKGEITPHMNSLYTFFNASVQGNTNFAKALYKSRKVKVAMGALVMAGYAQHVINSALAGDDDDGENAYKKMLRNEPWTFERNIVLFLPGSKDYIKIPLGFGMNAFWHLGSQAGAITTGDKGFLDGTLDSIRVAFDAFNPLGSGGWVSMALPSVIDPIWELGTNQNFSGNPIYPQENQFDPAPPPKSEQAFSSTHPAFRWGAETLNKISGGSDKLPGAVDVYPDSLEYLWGWFTGGVGRFAAQTAETAQRGVEMDFEPKKTPFIRSFYGAVDDQGKRSEYFAQREKVQYVAGKVKEFKEAGDEEGLKDFIADNEQDYAAVKAYEVAEKQRRRINKLRRKNEKRPDAADDLKALDEQELEIMNQARKAYFEAKPDAAE